jgi:hypothetical protein
MTDQQLEQLLSLDAAQGPALPIDAGHFDSIVDAALVGAGFGPPPPGGSSTNGNSSGNPSSGSASSSSASSGSASSGSASSGGMSSGSASSGGMSGSGATGAGGTTLAAGGTTLATGGTTLAAGGTTLAAGGTSGARMATGTKLAIVGGAALAVVVVALILGGRRAPRQELAVVTADAAVDAAPVGSGSETPIGSGSATPDIADMAIDDDAITIEPTTPTSPTSPTTTTEPMPSRKHAEKHAEKAADKPAEKPAEKPAAKPAEKPAAKPAEKPAEKKTADDLLGEANAKRAEKQWRDSDLLYGRVVDKAPRSLAAQTALVASGSLHLEHLRDPRGAAKRFRRALELAPSGGVAEDARWGLAEALRALHDDKGEAAALDDFLAHHASSPLASRARARRAELP